MQQIYTENPVVRLGHSLHNRNLEGTLGHYFKSINHVKVSIEKAVRLGHSLYTMNLEVRLRHSLYTRCLLSYLILDKGNIFKVKLQISPMVLH